MGRLIIDGNSFFEIDEECIKRKKVSPKCGLDKYLKNENENDKIKVKDMVEKKRRKYTFLVVQFNGLPPTRLLILQLLKDFI